MMKILPKWLIGFGAGALVGLGLVLVYAPVIDLRWPAALAVSNTFALAGLVVGWLGRRRSCSRMQVALLGFIVPLTSFLVVITSPLLSLVFRHAASELWGWVTAVLFWVLLNVILGWLATAALTWRRRSGKLGVT